MTLTWTTWGVTVLFIGAVAVVAFRCGIGWERASQVDADQPGGEGGWEDAEHVPAHEPPPLTRDELMDVLYADDSGGLLRHQAPPEQERHEPPETGPPPERLTWMLDESERHEPQAADGWNISDTGTMYPPIWLEMRPELTAAIPALGKGWQP